MNDGQVHRGLYPIIRRKRQPLVVEEPAPVAVAVAAPAGPANVSAGEKGPTAPAGRARKGKEGNGAA